MPPSEAHGHTTCASSWPSKQVSRDLAQSDSSGPPAASKCLRVRSRRASAASFSASVPHAHQRSRIRGPIMMLAEPAGTAQDGKSSLREVQVWSHCRGEQTWLASGYLSRH
eukprot:664458-Rhodomonas_salina.3